MKKSTKTNNNDIRILTVKWRNYEIGYLMKEEGVGYLYKYNIRGLRKARANGYTYLMGFKNVRKAYASKELFPTFKSRIPSKQRRDLDEKLRSLGMKEYDEFDYLVASGGKLHTDAITLEEGITKESKGER